MSLPFLPDKTDGGVQMLQAIFGDAVTRLIDTGNVGTDTSATLLGSAFGYFNSGVLFFGAIIIAFVGLIGIANSANDGEVLGSKWSTFYTPMRTLSASVLLIPTTSGLSGIQIFVLMVALYSCGFANTIWTGVVQYALNDEIANTVVSSIVSNQKLSELAVDAMRMQTCAAGVNDGLTRTLGTMGPAPLQLSAKSYVKTLADRSVETLNVLYVSPSWSGSEGLCGSISFSTTTLFPPKDMVSTLFTNGQESTAALELQLHSTVSEVRRKYILGLFGIGMTSPTQATVTQIVEAFSNSDPAAAASVDSTQLRDALAQRQAEYLKEIKSALQTKLASSNKNLVQALASGGWIYAGAWQRELARLKDAVRTAGAVDYEYDANRNTVETVLSGPILAAVKGSTEGFDYIVKPLIKKAVYGIGTTSSENLTTPKVPALRANFSYADFSDGGTDVQQHIKTYFNHSFTENSVVWVATYLGKDGADPIMQIKDLGDWMVTIVETYYIGKAALNVTLSSLRAGAKAANDNTVVGILSSFAGPAVIAGLEAAWQALQELVLMVSVPMGALIYLGYFMGIWIPMIPGFVFLIGVAGWVVAVIEAEIASSLWCAMHLTPDSNGSFIGGQSQGYLLLLSVYFRPALMIVGLVVSMVAIVPLLQYTNAFFVLSFRLVQTNSVTGLFSMAGYIMAYCFVVFSVLMMVFALPQTLPDRILKWIGGGVGDLGEHGTMSRIESGASGQARMAATAMGQKAAAGRQARIAAADRTLQQEQNKMLKQMSEGSKGHEPEGLGGQGVAPKRPSGGGE